MSTKTVVVCGASSDIGLALLERIFGCMEAVQVVAHCYRSEQRLAAFSERFGERLQIVKADLGSAEGCGAFAARVNELGWQPTHFVQLSALPLVYERFEKFDWQRFERDLQIQVGALVSLLPRWLPRARHEGSLRDVVVVGSSVTAAVPPKYLSMYTTVKYAQLGLLRSLAAEGAERGVVVNAVAPSMVDTRFLDELPSKARELAAAASPLGRNATADEVAEVVASLLSTRRPLLNGANIVLGGGGVF